MMFIWENLEPRKISKKIKELCEVSTSALSVESELLEATDKSAAQLTLPSKAIILKFPNGCDEERDLIHFSEPEAETSMCLKDFFSFVVHDTKKDDERKLVFGDSRKVSYLHSNLSKLADGTFELGPKMFYRPHDVHIQGHGVAPACVY